VAITPSGVYSLVQHGHEVIVEKGAGLGSGIRDEDYISQGAKIADSHEEVFERADMILKVKEPLEPEYNLLKEGQIVFTYFHFAASRELTRAMMERKIVAIAYETVELQDGSLPLLIPMSEVAGRMAPQEGAKYLERPFGGRGVLLGGVPGVPPARVVIIGGGTVGTNAAKIALGMGADVTVIDINPVRLRELDDILPGVKTLISTPYNIREEIKHADLVILAVLIHGAKAPKLITRDMLKTMSPGSVIVDVAIDQGGSAETSKPTTHSDPVYEVDGIIHYCVANMPGAVPRTSTFALTNSTLPFALEIANKGWKDAALSNPAIARGVNMVNGTITYEAVAKAFDFEYVPLNEVM
jgi:alanine dehydrogenase